jgi:hypothetical protein
LTVGEPEINLNSWGIRYVKKARVANEGQASSDIASRTTSHLSDADIATGTPADRQSDSAGDKDVKVVGHASRDVTTGGTPNERKHTTADNVGGNTPETAQQVHSTVDSKGQTHYSSGSRKRETISGNTSDDPTVGSTQGGKGTTAMTSGQQGKERKGAKVGDKLRHDPEVRAGQSHVGSETSHHSGIRHPQAAEYHENYDPKKPDRKPLQDTERNEYGAPVKFKKPKESTGGAARDIKRAMDLAILKCKNFKIKYHNYKNPNSYDANAGDNPVWQKDVESKTTIEDASGKETKPEKVADRYRKPTKKTSDEIVAKAIELINEAYGQIGKFDHGSGATKPSDVGLCDTCGGTGGHDDPDEHDSKNDCPSCGGTGGASTKPVKDSKTNKADSAVTTGTEGTNNPVNAGKKVVKVRSQEQADAGRKAAHEAQIEEDKKEAEKPKKKVTVPKGGDTDEYPAWHDKDTFY